MTISSEVRKAGPYDGNDVTTSFPFSFKVFSADDVVVVLTDPAGIETTLTGSGTDYSVALNADQDTAPGGTVNKVSALATGYLLTITSRMPNLQPLDLTNQGGFYPRVINDALDRLTILVQQVAEQTSRSLKVDISSNISYDQLLADIFTAAENAENLASVAQAAAAAAAASAANLPNATTAGGDKFIKTNTAGNAWEYQTATQTRASLGLGTVGTQLGLRNKIINGGCQVAQRSAVALSATANTTYCADRITVQAAGGTGLSGNGANTISGTGTRSGYIAGAIVCNWTNATMKIQTRLEAALVSMLSSKAITVSGKVYHDLGSTRTCQVVIQKANSVDNFSGVTTLGTSSTFSAPSGAYTPFSYTLTLGASDAANGLLISVEDTAASTATGKIFALGDLQLEEGEIATPFEVRPYGLELSLCQRYFEQNSSGGTLWSGTTQAGDVYYKDVKFSVQKRAIPSITFSDVANSGFPVGVPSGVAIAADLFWGSKSASASVGGGYFQFSWTASAEL